MKITKGYVCGENKMKFRTVIDPSVEDEVVIYARRRTSEIDEIEAYIANISTELVGYGADGSIVKLRLSDVNCFTVDGGRVYALTDGDRFHMRRRLCAIEELLDERFVKLNQSCVGNIGKIARFDVSFGGSLTAVFKNGYRDYVSRRQLKTVKERIGFNL